MFRHFEYVADSVHAFGAIYESRLVESSKAGTSVYSQIYIFLTFYRGMNVMSLFGSEWIDREVSFSSFLRPLVVVLIYWFEMLQTPLMLAAMHGKMSCVKSLLEAGANVCKVSSFTIQISLLFI